MVVKQFKHLEQSEKEKIDTLNDAANQRGSTKVVKIN